MRRFKRAGRLQMQILTADFEGFCRSAAKEKIILYEVSGKEPLTYQFYISCRDAGRIRKLCAGRGDRLKISGTAWFYSGLKRILSRPVLSSGLLFLLFLFLFLPTRVLFIKVSGNSRIPDLQILEAASDCGIHFGSSRRKLRSEEVKNGLLSRIPELSWTGINTKGCVAEISVKEHPKSIPESKALQDSGDITAVRDGIIESCSVRKGKLLCTAGQAVKKGQVLISGSWQDGNILRNVSAEGEIFAFTLRRMAAAAPSSCMVRTDAEKTIEGITLIVGKKRIKLLGSSGNLPPICGRMYQEYHIALPGGYQLPLALAVDSCISSSFQKREEDPDAVRQRFSSFRVHHLQNKMIAGRILQKNEQFTLQDGCFLLEGQYLCHEMIGKAGQAKMGVK